MSELLLRNEDKSSGQLLIDLKDGEIDAQFIESQKVENVSE